MTDSTKQSRAPSSEPAEAASGVDRRDALRALGRFAAVTPPTVGLMLAAASRPVHAGLISECLDAQVDDCQR